MRFKAGILCFLMGLMAVPALFAQDEETLPPILFDDFNYTTPDDPQLSENGWIIRDEIGWPGVAGAEWRIENVSFITDPNDDANNLLQMTSSIDGRAVYQTEICHQRKYLDGTYAARVKFSDIPDEGPDGDVVVQTFYVISTPDLETDPDYSELDFEYLPNGGWGFSDSVFFGTSWETYQLEPWVADNTSGITEESLDGWHVLVIQVADEHITYYLDGEILDIHDEYFYPEVPMSINFNLWFVDGGLLRSDEFRSYTEQVDWVFHAQNEVVSPDEILEQVETLRQAETPFVDTVPAWDPPLDSGCNF